LRRRRRYNRPVEFRILGPLEVVHDGRLVHVGAAKEHAVLAVLLLHAGEVVSRERLIDELWGESPPPTAAKAVNVHVSQLRKALAVNGADPIATRSGGYVIEVAPAALDATRFEWLVNDGRARVAAGDVEAAATILGDALALWRGPALAGLALESLGRNEVDRLEELRLGTLLDRIDCELALGRHENVVGELEVLVAQHPLRERLRAQYMLALYRCGRQADALRAYHDARKTLVDELGLEPSPSLQRLEKAILNHDPALEAPAGIRQPAPAPPRRRRSVVAVSAIVVAAAIAAIAVLLAAAQGHATTVPPNSIAVIDPATNRVVRAIGVGIDPGPVAVGAGAVWVGNREDRSLSRIDPRMRTVVRNLNLDGTPTGLAADTHGVWVAYGRLGSVARVLPQFGSVGAPLKIAGTAYGYWTPNGAIAVGPEGVWTAFGNSTIARISSDGTHLLAHGYGGTRPTAIAVGAGAVWITNDGNNTVWQVDPRTARPVARISVALKPRGLAVGDGAVWATAFDDDVVSRVYGNSSRTIPVGRGPIGIAYGKGALWVANSRDGTVSRIDPQREKVVATIHVGNRPEGIAVGAGEVWITVTAP
jgi:YVTN family beta-propeller protein